MISLPCVTTTDPPHYLSMRSVFSESFQSLNSQKTYIPWFYCSSSQQHWTINTGSKHGNTLFLLDVYRVKGDLGIKSHDWTLLEGLELHMHDMNRQELEFSRADIFQAARQKVEQMKMKNWSTEHSRCGVSTQTSCPRTRWCLWWLLNACSSQKPAMQLFWAVESQLCTQVS